MRKEAQAGPRKQQIDKAEVPPLHQFLDELPGW
jgi:hypothetical protein